jgi:hypothetical protein
LRVQGTVNSNNVVRDSPVYGQRCPARGRRTNPGKIRDWTWREFLISWIGFIVMDFEFLRGPARAVPLLQKLYHRPKNGGSILIDDISHCRAKSCIRKLEKTRYFWAENNSKNPQFSQKNARRWHSKAIPEV